MGYLITGVKDVRQSRVGDTITSQHHGAEESLGGFKHPNPMVFSGLYPIDGDDYPTLRDALEQAAAERRRPGLRAGDLRRLGFGFRCGFLGLLHMEIVRERLEREFNLDLISTAPNVVYEVDDGGRSEVVTVDQPERVPRRARSPSRVSRSSSATILTPSDVHRHDHGAVPGQARQLQGMDYLSEDRVELRYDMPLGEIVFDFFDHLKSRTQGYASLDYERSRLPAPTS